MRVFNFGGCNYEFEKIDPIEKLQLGCDEKWTYICLNLNLNLLKVVKAVNFRGQVLILNESNSIV